MSDETRTCSRPGCGKRLRSNNSTGECGSNCRSTEAPASKRAKDVVGRPARRVGPAPKAPPVAAPEGLERFRTVATALGKDPDALISAFAEGWLEALRERLEEADA